MHAIATLFAFPVWLGEPSYGSHTEMTEAMDLFALFTLGCLFFILGVIATWSWMLWRRSTRPTPHEQLLMEMHHHDPDEPAPAGETKAADGPAWERDADWWKEDA